MKRLIGLFVGVLFPAFMLVGVAATPAIAQDKAKLKEVKATNTIKVLHEDDRVRVTENTTKPGENGPNLLRTNVRVARVLQGGTQERTYADGRKVKLEREAGDVTVVGPDKEAYWSKNVGKTTIVIYVVNIKQPKK